MYTHCFKLSIVMHVTDDLSYRVSAGRTGLQEGCQTELVGKSTASQTLVGCWAFIDIVAYTVVQFQYTVVSMRYEICFPRFR
jgi:hypothetical protein